MHGVCVGNRITEYTDFGQYSEPFSSDFKKNLSQVWCKKVVQCKKTSLPKTGLPSFVKLPVAEIIIRELQVNVFAWSRWIITLYKIIRMKALLPATVMKLF